MKHNLSVGKILLLVFFLALFSLSTFSVRAQTDSEADKGELNKYLSGDVGKQSECENAVWSKYEKAMLPICKSVCKEFFWYGCMYDPDGASPIDAYACVKNNFPELKAELDECEKKYNAEPDIEKKSASSDINDELTKISECVDAVQAKYSKMEGYYQHGYWGGCEYSPGQTGDVQRKCIPGLQEELDACTIINGSLPKEASPASDAENSKNENGIIDFGVINGESSGNYEAETAAMAMELVRAEFDKAKSDLEKIKQSGDSRWEDKKNFADERNAKINKALADVSPDEADRLKEINQIVRTVGESGRDLLTTVQDVKDYYTEYRKTGKFSEYGGMSVFADTAGGMTDFLDMIDKNTSAEVAITKSVLDNYGVSLLNSIPALKVWDIAASSPDKVLKSFGVSEKNWSRKATIAVGEVSPSGVIKKTTKLMQENNWSNIGDALSRQLGKVQSAKGAKEIAVESYKLVAGTIGAVPVSAVRLLSDTVGGTIFVGQKSVDFVYNWFTK